MAKQFQVAIVGGGLAGALLAYRLRQQCPSFSVLLLEASSQLGGNHTWSFHERDLEPSHLQWVLPLVKKSWQGYSVSFPQYNRSFNSSYYSISSTQFHSVISSTLGPIVRFNSPAKSVEAQRVVLEGGEEISASVVIDARGFQEINDRAVGYQKFVGWDVELDAPHGLQRPVIKDVTCEQLDGYRFFYLLPWSETSLLIEDTRYSDGPEIDVAAFECEIQKYLKSKNWSVKQVLRKEVAALPIPMCQEIAPPTDPSLPVIGVRAGFFNSTTGYSVPDAVRVAEGLSRVLAEGEGNVSAVKTYLGDYGRNLQKRESYFRLLNRMLFRAAEPEKRFEVLQRFYRLSEGLVERFYSGRLRWHDRFRILAGKPPVPISKALRCLREASV